MRRKNVFNHLVIDAVFSAPFMLLGPTKKERAPHGNGSRFLHAIQSGDLE